MSTDSISMAPPLKFTTHGEYRLMPSSIDLERIDILRKSVSQTWLTSLKGRVQEIPELHPFKRESLQVARQLRDQNDVPGDHVRTWTNLQRPDPGEGYSDGYPHVHQNRAGVSLVLYLSENPSPLDIIDDGVVIETLRPQIGDVALIRNGVWHGAHRNPGPSDRVALIITVYP